MKNDFIVKCIYKGSEEYKIKDKDDIIILHEFLDSVGNSFKFTLQNDFDGTPGKSYLLNLRLGDTRRDGIYKKYWSIHPIDPLECKEG